MEDRILLAHGSGGKLTHELVERLIVPALNNPTLLVLDDSATMDFHGRLAFTTDSFVVTPPFFPGGDIGRLAVCGTVNDLACVGAHPVALSLSFIIEEGLLFSELERVVESIRLTAQEAGVPIVTGDTKVVQRGAADRIFINTSGIGRIPEGIHVSGSNVRSGDVVLINGGIAEHGIAVLSGREGLTFGSGVVSDCAPLAGLVARMLEASPRIHCMRDPTRGGLATTLNEIAHQSNVGIIIVEQQIPVQDAVLGACEMLGHDPLYVANEGKVVVFCPPEDAQAVLSAMRSHPLGRDGVVIGEVTSRDPGRVAMKTRVGTYRIVDMMSGDLLPRIC